MSVTPLGWVATIGLEVHAQLLTQSKLFSGAPARFGDDPNTNISPVDCGLPGVLPVLNERAVEKAIRFGLALGADICHTMKFDRKHYFYPDLPKGYQITQLTDPIISSGEIYIPKDDDEDDTMRVRITRAHLEEDAGKSIHDLMSDRTAIDLNRAGTPLLEIVTEPDIHTPQQAVNYLKKLHTLLRWLEISDGNMAEGSMRCDANVSVARIGDTQLGQRAEIKNLNSFRFIEKAISYEILRQVQILEGGGVVGQSTRLYDEKKGETRLMRSKEDTADYRYFPEPDLLPIELDESWMARIQDAMIELPNARKERYMTDLKLTAYTAGVLTSSRQLSDYFEGVYQACGNAQLAANWVTGDFLAQVNDDGVDHNKLPSLPLTAKDLGKLVQLLSQGRISGPVAKKLFEQLWREGGDPEKLMQASGLELISDTNALTDLVKEVLADNPIQLEQYRQGKTKLLGYFVGQAMKKSQGRADPAEFQKLLRDALDKS